MNTNLRNITVTARVRIVGKDFHTIRLTYSIACAILATRRGDIRRALAGLRLYLRRQAGRSLPQGEKDPRGCWYPSVAERRDCYTEDVVTPTSAHKMAYYKAACTLDHCAHMEHSDPALVRALRRAGCDGTEVPTAITMIAKRFIERTAVAQARAA